MDGLRLVQSQAPRIMARMVVRVTRAAVAVLVLVAVQMAVPSPAVWAAESLPLAVLPGDAREADHQAVQALLPQAAAALAGGEALDGLLAPGFRLTTPDQRTFESRDGLIAHLARIRDERAVSSLAIAPRLDGAVVFFGADAGWCDGTAVCTLVTAQGTVVFDARWTATVVRDQGRWKIATLHAGVDPAANPLIDRSRTALRIALPVIGIGFLLVGMALGFVIARRRK